MKEKIVLSWTPEYYSKPYTHEVFADQQEAASRLHELIEKDRSTEVPDLSFRAYYLKDGPVEEAIATIDALLNSPTIVPISLRLIDGTSRQKPHKAKSCLKKCDAES